MNKNYENSLKINNNFKISVFLHLTNRAEKMQSFTNYFVDVFLCKHLILSNKSVTHISSSLPPSFRKKTKVSISFNYSDTLQVTREIFVSLCDILCALCGKKRAFKTAFITPKFKNRAATVSQKKRARPAKPL